MFSSCVSYEQLLNFRKEKEFVQLENHPISNFKSITIQPNDILHITIHSTDPIAAQPYNLNVGTGVANRDILQLNGYLVSTEGTIEMPNIGPLKVEGLTVEELRTKLNTVLSPYLTDPVVNIRFLNFKVTVIGEVTRPTEIQVPGERITILEALGKAGDFTPYSNRDVVTIIRESDGEREFGYIDLRSKDVFSSPFFYLQQNDVVYVEPLSEKTGAVRDPLTEALPVISSLLSLTAIIISLTR